MRPSEQRHIALPQFPLAKKKKKKVHELNTTTGQLLKNSLLVLDSFERVTLLPLQIPPKEITALKTVMKAHLFSMLK